MNPMKEAIRSGFVLDSFRLCRFRRSGRAIRCRSGAGQHQKNARHAPVDCGTRHQGFALPDGGTAGLSPPSFALVQEAAPASSQHMLHSPNSQLPASVRARTVTAVLGPTNTGKTHLAIERMIARESGIIGLPLRLLAREVYGRIVARVGEDKVALVTGEEKVIPTDARYWVSTVEAMPLDLKTDFVAIDEVQLAGDLERGHVFTDRILGLRGREETLLLGSSSVRGILENLPRVLPEGVGARVHRDSWSRPPVFNWLQAGGNIDELEMMRTFNCGVGMILVVAAEHATGTLSQLNALGLSGWGLGEISDAAVGVELC